MFEPWNPAEVDGRAHLAGLLRLARAVPAAPPAPTLQGWLASLSRLGPVPLDALIDAPELPPESLWMQVVDPGWLDALRHGALLAGSQGRCDEALARALLAGLDALPAAPQAAMVLVLRSARLSVSPGPIVQAFRDAPATIPVAPLWSRPLPPDRLLIVYDVAPAHLRLHEGPLQFGADPTADPQDLPMRDPTLGVLDIAALARRAADRGLSLAELLRQPAAPRDLPTTDAPDGEPA